MTAIVRAGSLERARALFAGTPVELVAGDLELPLLGVDPERLREAGDFFHLAALYDLAAPPEAIRAASVEGTRNALELAGAIGARCFHHVSSVAVAGDHRGVYAEDDLDVGQGFPTPYQRAKFDAELAVRGQSALPWRIYRPSVIVGDSRSGAMDKVDGPYYFFKAIARLRHLIPAWVPLVGPEARR